MAPKLRGGGLLSLLALAIIFLFGQRRLTNAAFSFGKILRAFINGLLDKEALDSRK